MATIDFSILNQGLDQPSAFAQQQNALADRQMKQQQLSNAQMQNQLMRDQFGEKKAAAERVATFRQTLAEKGQSGDLKAIAQHLLSSDDEKTVLHGVAMLKDINDANEFDSYLTKLNGGPPPAANNPAPVANNLAPVANSPAPAENNLAPVEVTGNRYVRTPIIDPTAARMAGSSNPRYAAVGKTLLDRTAPNDLTKLDIQENMLIDAGVPEDDPRFKQIAAMRQNLTAPTNADIREYEYGLTNPNFIAQQLAKKKAGAAQNNVNVSTEKKYGEQFAGKVAEADVALRDAADKAPSIAENSNRILGILNSGQVFTGTGANVKLQLAKSLKLAGGNDSESIANTEVLVSSLADSTLGAIKSSGLGSGQGFTNTDRDFLEKAKSGQLTYDAESLKKLAELSYRAAVATADKYNKRIKTIPKSAIEGTGISTEPISIPPLANKKANAPSTNSNGWVSHTDAKGNRAYVSPDGKQFQEIK